MKSLKEQMMEIRNEIVKYPTNDENPYFSTLRSSDAYTHLEECKKQFGASEEDIRVPSQESIIQYIKDNAILSLRDKLNILVDNHMVSLSSITAEAGLSQDTLYRFRSGGNISMSNYSKIEEAVNYIIGIKKAIIDILK
jgi:DNA-binding phage protein